MAEKQALEKAKSDNVFGQSRSMPVFVGPITVAVASASLETQGPAKPDCLG
jgi:hypothetical protein